MRDYLRAVDGGDLVPPGRALLMKNGKVVWLALLGQPIEDVDFDEMVLNSGDYASLRAFCQ